jgi:sec-independent protein translocase protein TatB
MFDFAWTEIALIGVVALVAIGPKDLPVAIKAVANMIKKARRMASEFQTHVDEMVREANLDEVRSQISQIRNLDIKGTIERAVDSDGSIRKTFSEDPLRSTYDVTPTPTPESKPADPHATTESPAPVPSDLSLPELDVAARETRTMDRPSWLDSADGATGVQAADTGGVQAPAFIPPSIAAPPVPPAFIPPGFSPHGASPGGRRPSL